MLSDLVNQLIKSIHDLINHQNASTVVEDIAVTAEDVAGIIPEVTTPNAGLVADAVNAVAFLVKSEVPASK